MRLTGTHGVYEEIDGVQVSIGSDFVIMSANRTWAMLNPHDARALAAQLTKAANHVIAVLLDKALEGTAGADRPDREE